MNGDYNFVYCLSFFCSHHYPYKFMIFRITFFVFLSSFFVHAQTLCKNGMAGQYACENVDLLGKLSNAQLGVKAANGTLAVIWGWTDPQTQKEYAIVGHWEGTSFVDVSNPKQPNFLGVLPIPALANPAGWREIKTVGDYAYIVGDNAGPHGLQVFDLKRLRYIQNNPQTFTPDFHYTAFGSAHNIAANESSKTIYVTGINSWGSLYGYCGGGLYVMSVENPLAPTFLSCYQHPNVGRVDTGYAHDVLCVDYQGQDVDWKGKEICVGFNETHVTFADASNKAALVPISKVTYPYAGYIHQGWFSADFNYLYVNDEFDERNGTVDKTTTHIFEVKDLDNPQKIGVYQGETRAVDHNLFVRDNLLYESNYTSGLRILDITNPIAPQEAAFLDTYPQDDLPTYNGQWGNYPYFKSGIVVASDRNNGLFVLAPRLPQKAALSVAALSTGGNVLSWKMPAMMYGLTQFRIERSKGGGFVSLAQKPIEQLSTADGFTFFDINGSADDVYRIAYILADTPQLLYSEVANVRQNVPPSFSVGQSFPNPARQQTVYLPYALAQTEQVEISIWNLLGQQQSILFTGEQRAGYYHQAIDTQFLSRGVYFYLLKTATSAVQGRFVVE
jgi:choice-of-anchor B domain-containing protein